MDFNPIFDSLKLTPTQLSRRLGCSDGHIHDLLKGRRKLTINLALRLENEFGKAGIVEKVLAEQVRKASGRRAA